MKAVILCGGRGTRLGNDGQRIPKALLRIGEDPILTHLMRHYAAFGVQEFILCLGFLGDTIRAHFTAHPPAVGRITFLDTGLDTPTGGRLAQARALLAGEPRCCVTYGDGLCNVDVERLVAFHMAHGRMATLTAVHPHSAFGLLTLSEDARVTAFREKPRMADWVNGGFFVFESRVLDRLAPDVVLEGAPLEELACAGELMAYRHDGFWKCMDTAKDHHELEALWHAGRAPWHH